MKFFGRLRYQPWFIKLTHWEYWSFNTVYIPVMWYYGWLSLKARTFGFFSAANPGIEYGGFLAESKWKIHQVLPAYCTPATVFTEPRMHPDEVIRIAGNINFPAICKPNIGSRGRGVSVIHHAGELAAYHRQCPLPFLVQQKIDYAHEAGIFYVRMPHQQRGFISGIVEKKYVSVTGNGQSTIGELLAGEPRYVLQLPVLEKMLGSRLQEVLPAGKKEILVPFGNHARGCLFLDSTHRTNEALTRAIDDVCRKIPGFYYGRLDIKFESWELLEAGKAFAIIELNGSGSEPTHMYDPRHSIFFAWKEIIRHWKLLYEVSVINHKQGHAYLNRAETRKMFALNREVDKYLDHFLFVPSGKMERPRLTP